MLIYCTTLALTVLFAAAATHYSEPLRLRIDRSGKIVSISRKNIAVFLSFLPMFLVSALRFHVGGDYVGYERIFRNVQEGTDIYAEPGFGLLNKLVIWYSGDIQWVYALSAAVTLILLFYGIYRYSPSPAMSLYLFVTMGYFFSSFNILRQFIAVSILFAGFRFLKEGRFVPYLALVLVAMTFHKTAIVMIPLYFLVRLRLKQSYMITLGLLGLCILPLQSRLTPFLVNTFYPQYADTDLIQPLSTFEFLYYLALFALLLFLATRYRERFFQDETNTLLFNCAYYTFLIYLCLSFVPEINRIALYLEIFVIVLIPRLIHSEPDPKVRRLYTGFIAAGFAAFCLISLAVLGRYNVLPYVSVFSAPTG